MDIQRDVAPGGAGERRAPAPRTIEYVEPSRNTSSFKAAVAAIERYRKLVRTSVAVALVVRLQLEFNLYPLVLDSDALLARVPYIGLALLAYLLVIMWMAKGSGDRLGFGMALGLGVLQPAYLAVMMATQASFDMATAWPSITVAVVHLPMAIFALRSASAYPHSDDKGPWILGFLIALLFLSMPWLAPPIVELFGG